ncbi:GntR family transcriptional regulator [Corynebacterium crudilactis]|uniref:GntR family transcriptional regulator n=1 Tax=Corynebacterium crudilactis TaxID=1652495 RepID=A0A172QSH4_9CORY|nr:GntR family transcriptional regulator [Corynebacterium crudilactis]ANE03624.1 GntR family transcriptional regulator [Corynebacterium crudilactis]
MTQAIAVSLDLAARITAKIDRGELTPGTRLSEVALAEELGVSRNTLREAFRVLMRDGLVDHIPNRGVFVHTFTRADVEDLYAYRMFIEISAIRAARHKSEILEKSLDTMREAYERGAAANAVGDWQTVGSANSAFHLAIVDLAGVARLSADARKVLALARIGFMATYNVETFHSIYVEMNHQILKYLVAKEFEEAEKYVEKYFEYSRRDLFEHLPEN